MISALKERESYLRGNVLVDSLAPVVALSDDLGFMWLTKSGSSVEKKK